MIGGIPFAPRAFMVKCLMSVALSFGLAGVTATSALAEKPKFQNIEIGGGFDVETIFVEQENDMWTRISDHPRTIPIYITIEMSRGYIQFYRIGRNLTNGAVRDIFSTYRVNDYGNGTDNAIAAKINSRTSVAGPVNILIDEYTRLNATDEQAIVNRCNSEWTQIEPGHSFSYSLPLAMHADAREHRRLRFPYYLNEYEGYGDFARTTATGSVGLKVICLGRGVKYPHGDSKPPEDSDGVPRAGDTSEVPDDQTLGFDQGPMTVSDIRLSLTTYSNAYSKPTAGTKCKKAKLRVTMETNQEGPVSFRLWQQRGDGDIGSEEIDLVAHHDDGHFRAVHERWVEVDETTNVRFNARDLVNATFNKETGWKDITLHCTGAGGGGFVNPTDDDDDNVPSTTAFQGNFQFIDNGALAKRNTCPRDAKALIWFNAPKQDSIHYSLDCGALGNFSGVLQPEQVGNSHFSAGKLIGIGIVDTIEAGCTLRTVAPGNARDHAFKAHTFQCAIPAGHSGDIDTMTGISPDADPGLPTPKPKPGLNPAIGGGVGGLVAEPKPTDTPRGRSSGDPAITPMVCKGGAIRDGKCHCPRAKTREKISRFEYLCKSKATATPAKPERNAAPVRTNPTPAKPRLVCVGGKIAKGACRCGPNKIRKKTGNRSYQCIAVAKPPAKKKAVRSNPKSEKPARVNPKSKKKHVVCRGGTVRGGACRCRSNRRLVKVGSNAFVCQIKAVRSDAKPKRKSMKPRRAGPKAKPARR